VFYFYIVLGLPEKGPVKRLLEKGPALSQWSLPAMVTIVLSLSLP
jgi:hypothetical protein